MLHRVEDKRRLSKKIQDHLKSSPELRPFPEAVTRLVAACRDANSTNKEIEEIVACDPSLSVKVLRLANSPLFCPSRDVTSIIHALALLGRRKIKSLGMSVAAANMFSSGDGAAVHRQNLWTHSVGCASVATCLASHVRGVEPADAFLAGIFHDVGKLLFFDVICDEYVELLGSAQGNIIEEEEFLFGTTHEEIGVNSANLWGLPNEILAAIGWHHRVHEAPFCETHARLIAVADNLSKHWGLGAKRITRSELVFEFCDEFDLGDEKLDQIEAEAKESFEQTMTSSG